jgi:hypothetical protein
MGRRAAASPSRPTTRNGEFLLTERGSELLTWRSFRLGRKAACTFVGASPNPMLRIYWRLVRPLIV